MKDDILLVNENNYNHSIHLMNGDFLKVKKVLNRESRMISLRGRETVELVFRDILVSSIDSNETYEFKCKILENLLVSKNTMISRDERSALLVDLIIRNKDVKPKSKEFQELMKTDQYQPISLMLPDKLHLLPSQQM